MQQRVFVEEGSMFIEIWQLSHAKYYSVPLPLLSPKFLTNCGVEKGVFSGVNLVNRPQPEIMQD
jgi:hypothetical protein